jgi:DNA-directed RNA polymerase subunit E'/Rpb7
MESTAFFEKKISLTPSDFNEVKSTPIEEILLRKARESIENKCSEQGFVLPGSLQLLSRSMGYFESARFTGEAIYYVKLEGKVVYPVEGVQVLGKVIRKNKMGLYINYNDAIRIQVPRDLHLNEPEFEEVQIGDNVYVELKRSKFAIHDTYILASGLFLRKDGPARVVAEESDMESEEEEPAPTVPEEEVPAEAESEVQSEAESEPEVAEDDEEDED